MLQDNPDFPSLDDPLPGSGKKGGKKGTIVYKGSSKQVDRSRQGVPGTYEGCWAIDQVIIVNSAHTPDNLQEGFSPVDPSLWLMMPGAHFKVRTMLYYCPDFLITLVILGYSLLPILYTILGLILFGTLFD